MSTPQNIVTQSGMDPNPFIHFWLHMNMADTTDALQLEAFWGRADAEQIFHDGDHYLGKLESYTISEAGWIIMRASPLLHVASTGGDHVSLQDNNPKWRILTLQENYDLQFDDCWLLSEGRLRARYKAKTGERIMFSRDPIDAHTFNFLTAKS